MVANTAICIALLAAGMALSVSCECNTTAGQMWLSSTDEATQGKSEAAIKPMCREIRMVLNLSDDALEDCSRQSLLTTEMDRTRLTCQLKETCNLTTSCPFSESQIKKRNSECDQFGVLVCLRTGLSVEHYKKLLEKKMDIEDAINRCNTLKSGLLCAEPLLSGCKKASTLVNDYLDLVKCLYSKICPSVYRRDVGYVCTQSAHDKLPVTNYDLECDLVNAYECLVKYIDEKANGAFSSNATTRVIAKACTHVGSGIPCAENAIRKCGMYGDSVNTQVAPTTDRLLQAKCDSSYWCPSSKYTCESGKIPVGYTTSSTSPVQVKAQVGQVSGDSAESVTSPSQLLSALCLSLACLALREY